MHKARPTAARFNVASVPFVACPRRGREEWVSHTDAFRSQPTHHNDDDTTLRILTKRDWPRLPRRNDRRTFVPETARPFTFPSHVRATKSPLVSGLCRETACIRYERNGILGKYCRASERTFLSFPLYLPPPNTFPLSGSFRNSQVEKSFKFFSKNNTLPTFLYRNIIKRIFLVCNDAFRAVWP